MLKTSLLFILLCSQVLAANPSGRMSPLTDIQKIARFEEAFTVSSIEPTRLKAMAFSLKQKSVPTLIKVMKEATFPERNRWHATMLLGQVMGKKSAAFIARFTEHPAWMMRVASLKALAALGMHEYHAIYAKALKDASLIVRVQALDNIAHMKITKLAPHVWNMMYDQTNYTGSAGKRKRTSIVRSIIRTVGELKYAPAKTALTKLIQKPKYQDLAEDLDYSLENITGKVSPNNSIQTRREFWNKQTI
ncbi:MAG: HEAT repeat domain-containing protein [Bacteriovoracaceae bacterium]|nr:HEAT repeat domain-containing protein [Bacteriovoracaceae bacterium]